MRTRHRVPTIFTLSMLDVLCCALGAVILIMLLKSWEARHQATELAQSRQEFDKTSRELAQSRDEFDKTSRELRESKLALESSGKALEQVQGKLRQTSAELTQAEQDLIARRKEREELEGKLKGTERSAADMSARLSVTEAALARTRKALLMTAQEKAIALEELAAAQRNLASQKQALETITARLEAAEKARTESAAVAALVPGLRQDIESSKKAAKANEAELADLRKQADALGLRLTDVQKESQTVQVEVTTLRKLLEQQRTAAGSLQTRLAQSENRFAGVDLGGRRVIFLVDTSGSMGSVDAETPDANKWPEVGRTVAHLLRSLREAEKFQVILFADEPQYLLGRPGQWLDYDRQQTPDEVGRALARVTPKGNTNMFAAFDTAFRYRGLGLDTVYVISDGLPNIGPGLPARPPEDETAQSGLLGKYLRTTIRTRWNTNEPRVRIHAVGFFYESPSLGAFLWALTRENGGSFVGMSKP